MSAKNLWLSGSSIKLLSATLNKLKFVFVPSGKKESGSRSCSPVPVVAKELTEEEKAAIVSSEGFLTFLTRSSQLVERKITSEVDVYKPYIQEDDDKSS